MLRDSRFSNNPKGRVPRALPFGYLRNQIIKGELKADERIREAELAKELGVSRGPIREGLQILEIKRLVERKPSRGTRVVRMSSSYADWL
jgi:DNA-binding GntR family transcriptional regulator